MANIYVSNSDWTAVAVWTSNTLVTVGTLRRQVTATVNNERVFVCTTGGTTGATQPTWVLTYGATTSDNGVVWTEITGRPIYNGEGGGSPWAAPHARVYPALLAGWYTAGDTILAASDHTETATVAGVWTILGTHVSPTRILSVDETVVPSVNLTTLKAGATHIGNSAANHSILGSLTKGVGYIYGFNFLTTTGTGSRSTIIGGAGTAYSIVLENCLFHVRSTGVGAGTGVTTTSASTTSSYAKIKFINSVFRFSSIAHVITLGYGTIDFIGCSLHPSSTIPTTLFTAAVSSCNMTKIRSCDFSLLTTTLYTATNDGAGEVNVMQSKFGNGVNILAGTLSFGCVLKVQNCDSTTTNYRNYLATYSGTLIQETTTVLSGGASNGVTPLSMNMTSSANTEIEHYLYSDELSIWNKITGVAKTINIHFAGSTTLNNADVWMEVEYLGDSSTPMSTIATSRVSDILQTGTDYPVSGETWGGSPSNKQYMSVNITPAMVGYIKVRICLAKPSTTVYIDPKIRIV